ncbi:hypothetical protein HRbin39_01409 [bacterium HR39]|nr:hypothetical protein HRbin39_01409 [bacterium HR39]
METFESGLDLFHIVFVKGRLPERWATTRDWLYGKPLLLDGDSLQYYPVGGPS